MAQTEFGFSIRSIRNHGASVVSLLAEMVRQFDARKQPSEEEKMFLRNSLSLLVQWRNRVMADSDVLKLNEEDQLDATIQIDYAIEDVLCKLRRRNMQMKRYDPEYDDNLDLPSDPEDSNGETEGIDEAEEIGQAEGIVQAEGISQTEPEPDKGNTHTQEEERLPEQPVKVTTPKVDRACGSSTPEFNVNCHFCEGKHLLINCQWFRNLLSTQRVKFVKEKSICINCFVSSHRVADCPREPRCTLCPGKHHSKLHAGLERLKIPRT